MNQVRRIQGLLAIAALFIGSSSAIGQEKPKEPVPHIRQRGVCPTDIQPLAKLLLRDLPTYINRLSHQQKGSQAGFYAIASSLPDFTPLPVASSQNPDPQEGSLHQVFFTILERQYETQQVREFQHHHWLFLAHSDRTGWQLAMLYSRRNSYPISQPVTSPMRETSQEAIGKAIRLWLRDCEARSIT